MLKSSAFRVACSTPMAICVAPGAPMMSSGLPSLNTIDGTTDTLDYSALGASTVSVKHHEPSVLTD
jgi:hypothetical protein